jgi:forkhead protein FKH
MVSRKHASIAYENEEWWLAVFGRNGVKLDGTSIQMDDRVTLANGYSCPGSIPLSKIDLVCRSVLEIGGIQMMFVLPSPLTRATLLQIHAQQHNLPLPLQTPAPAKRTTIPRRSSSSPSSMSYPQGVRIVQGPRIITSPNITEFASHGEIDLSLESSKEIKPQFSYAMMIAQAILSVPEQKMQLSKIYEFIMNRYAFYRYTKSGWQVPTTPLFQLFLSRC